MVLVKRNVTDMDMQLPSQSDYGVTQQRWEEIELLLSLKRRSNVKIKIKKIEGEKAHLALFW